MCFADIWHSANKFASYMPPGKQYSCSLYKQIELDVWMYGMTTLQFWSTSIYMIPKFSTPLIQTEKPCFNSASFFCVSNTHLSLSLLHWAIRVKYMHWCVYYASMNFTGMLCLYVTNCRCVNTVSIGKNNQIYMYSTNEFRKQLSR